MKLQPKMPLMVAFLVLAVPLVFAGIARAIYNPDGAVQNADGSWSIVNNYCVGVSSGYVPNSTPLPTNNPGPAVKRTDLNAANCSPSPVYYLTTIYTTQSACEGAGYIWRSGNCRALMWTGDNPDAPGTWFFGLNGCLRCHNEAYMEARGHGTEAAKGGYLKTGHKNILRKVTPGISQAGPDGTPYPTVSFNNLPLTPNWTDGTVTDAGGFSHQLYWIVNGWMNPTGARAYGDNAPGPKSSYGCGRCHATGWTSDAAPNSLKEPELSFPGVSGKVNLAGGVTGDSNAYSSWDQYGIQCSRCHQATDGGHATFPSSRSKGGDVTAMCANCHRQESGGVPRNQDSPGTKLSFGLSHGSIGFTSHGPVSQFLNSPHAKFTGSWGDIGCPPTSIVPAWPYTCDSSMSKYASAFGQAGIANLGKSSTSGGCSTCHDLHQSTVAATGQKEGIVACTSCHANSTTDVVSGKHITPQIDLSAIRHPSGWGTPFDYENPCAVCHMPGGEHLMRINTDVNYSTFPAGATSGLANTASDGYYANAVWNDLDSACGQCHGEGGGAKPLSKNQLARYAKGIHGAKWNTPPTAAMTALPTVTGYTVSFKDNSTDVEDPQSALRIAVDWGDWTVETGLAGGTFSHTYISGGAFTIRHTATDTRGLRGYESVSVVISGRR